MPLHMRLPKLPGFRNFNRLEYTVVNLARLDTFDAGSLVDPDALRSRGLVRKKGPLKVLGTGQITKSLHVRAHAFSESARSKIEAAGGAAEVIEAAGGAAEIIETKKTASDKKDK